MRWRGPRTKAWEQARRELKVQFQLWQIVYCELRYAGCAGGVSLGFAHAKKRSQHPQMYRSDELKRVCLACNPCHDILERKPPEEMNRIVSEVIELRERILTLKGYGEF